MSNLNSLDFNLLKALHVLLEERNVTRAPRRRALGTHTTCRKRYVKPTAPQAGRPAIRPFGTGHDSHRPCFGSCRAIAKNHQ